MNGSAQDRCAKAPVDKGRVQTAANDRNKKKYTTERRRITQQKEALDSIWKVSIN